LGHIINLAAKALCFSANAKALEIENGIGVEKILAKETAQPNLTKKATKKVESTQEKLHMLRSLSAARWRKHGTIGKVHNVVQYIRSSPQRRNKYLNQYLEKLQEVPALMVVADNETCWNSTCAMLESVLEQRD